MEGGCRCDRIRFRISAPPLLALACHCTGCQRMTASAYSLSLMIPSDGFAVTAGEPMIGGLLGPHRHPFCGYCMSWVFTRIDGYDTIVNVRATLLDDPSWFVPYVETMTSEKLPWVTTPAAHGYEKWPTLEDYRRLSAEYVASSGRAG
jgi:hypothetical protein